MKLSFVIRTFAAKALVLVGLAPLFACLNSAGDDTAGRLAMLQYALPYLARGELDGTFAGPGFAVYTPSGGNTVNENAGGIALDAANNIYVAGPRDSGDGSATGAADMAIWRYSPAGLLDLAWGGTGYVTHRNAGAGNGSDIANDMVRDSAGRLVVVGSTVENGGGDTDFVIWRFNADGSLDTTFNGRGFNTFGNVSSDGAADIALAVTLDSAERIIVVGSLNGMFSTSDMIVMRLTADGVLDTSFNSTGYFIHSGAAGAGLGNDAAQDVVVDDQDRAIIVGRSENGAGDQDMVLWRMDTSGRLDSTFGSGGIALHAGAAGGTAGNDSGVGLVLTGDGIIVAGGSVNAAADFDMVVWAFTTAGVLDTSFGTAGGFTVTADPLTSGFDNANHLTLDAYGNIIVVGSANNTSGNTDMIVRRYSANGIPDGSFASGGFLTHDNAAGGSSIDFANRVVIDGLGRILIGGASSEAAFIRRMTLWRVR